MIKNLIFDMGGVLIHFDRNYFLKHLGVSTEDAKLLMEQVYMTLEWAQLDRGTLNEEQAVEIMCKRVPERLHETVRWLVMLWDQELIEVSGMYELIEGLYNKGYHIYLLSNASSRQHEYWPRISTSKFFTDTVISADIKLVKPQPEIYKYTCSKFGIEMSESIFIDDMPGNVEGAVFTGLDAVMFRDAPRLRKELAARGIDI